MLSPVLAILAPGQGAQTPGFLAPWLELPSFAAQLAWASAVVGIDLIAAGTTGSAEEIRDTAVAQPLLVAAGLAVAAELGPLPRVVVAGHSVGELTAGAVAGALTTEAALVLARARGAAMARAAALEPTGMAAVIGGDAEVVTAAVVQAGLTVANANGAGQLVAAGSTVNLERLPDLLAGLARVVPLPVAGAFHTEYMAPARDELESLREAVPVRDPRQPLLSNADGSAVTTGADLVNRLIAQVAAPVRWDRCLDALADRDVTVVVELAPGGTLTAIARRALPGVAALALRTPDDLQSARALLADQPDAHASPTWRIVVSPSAGVFAPATRYAALLDPGALIGHVRGRREETAVHTPDGGHVIELLASDGDPVKAGQPLARLHPLGVDA